MKTIRPKESLKNKTTSKKTSKNTKTVNKQKLNNPKLNNPKSSSNNDLGLVPITPELERTLNKSFDSLERYLKGMYYSTPIFIIFPLYWVFKSGGNILNILIFLFFIPYSIGIIYSYRFLLKQNKKSINAFSISLGSFILLDIISIWILSLRAFTLADFIGFIFLSAFLIEMLRLKKYNYLY